MTAEKRKAVIDEVEKGLNAKGDQADRKTIALQGQLEELRKETQAGEILRDLPPLMDTNEVAVEEAVAVHQANVQRVTAVEVRIFCHQSYRRTSLNPLVLPQASLESITSAESIPHRDGPIQILEKSLPNMDSRTAQLQEFAEGIARLINKFPWSGVRSTPRQKTSLFRAFVPVSQCAWAGYQEVVVTSQLYIHSVILMTTRLLLTTTSC